ncbi:secreted RxLR effector protein 161-like [Bidens hawaiensis]|uniref:secreted RxLR effector protein 161-like n=1 Tax=Bidens hawaiensis TaxID=980011 RepID=UPI00404AA6F1
MEAGLKLSKNEEGVKANATEYRKLIRCLRYLTHTRPDINFTVGYASRFMHSPKVAHMKAVKHLLRYVRGTIEYGIHYKKGGIKVLKGYSDSSYNMDVDDGKSTIGTVFYICDAPIAWNTRKQSIVALSSCEAEFMAAASTACQA